MIRPLTYLCILAAFCTQVFAQEQLQKTSSANSGEIEASQPEVSIVFNEGAKVISVAFRDAVMHIDELSVYNIIGKDLYQLQMEKIGDKIFLIDAHSLQPGIYFLRIKTGSFEHTERITVKPGNTQFSVSSREFISVIS